MLFLTYVLGWEKHKWENTSSRVILNTFHHITTHEMPPTHLITNAEEDLTLSLHVQLMVQVTINLFSFPVFLEKPS
jgi:hypothetical protein